MKKLMIKILAWLKSLALTIFVQPIVAITQWTKRKVSPPLKIRLTRQSLMISLPASQGGRLHILPRPGSASGLTRTFEVVIRPESQYELRASPDNLALATYSSKAEAALALSALNKAFTGSLVWKWGFRFFLVWLAWLFITSYMEVRAQRSNPSRPDIIAMGPAQGGGLPSMPNIPLEPDQFQPTPSPAAPTGSDLTNYIYQQAKLAQEKSQKDALPPKAGVDNVAGLAAFGLKAESNGSVAGCDPKLAFKVPQK